MNRIYKVVWSKVKHCYVVTSELAKRNGKGCGVRSLRMAAVSMGIAAALIGVIGSSVAEAGGFVPTGGGTGVVTVSDASDPIGSATPRMVLIPGTTVMTSSMKVRGTVVSPSLPTIKTLNITGGTGTNDFLGFYSTTEDVAGHTVNLSGSATIGSLYGGYVDGAFSANNNNLNISGDATTVSAAFGGRSNDGAVNGNTVTISGGAPTVTGIVCGGLSMNSNATENRVVIKGGNFGSIVIGGHTTTGKKATDNKVTIEGGTITGNIYGGLSQNGTAGAANNNTVTISGGTINKQVFGGNSAAGDANNNTITVSGGTIKDDIMGGYSTDHKADDNTVTISGSPEISSSAQIWGGNARTSASNNTVNILSPITVSLIQGGYVANADGQITGNTLNIAAKGVTTGAVKGFQNMNFYLPSDIAKDDTMLTVNGSNATNVKGVTFGVAALSGVNLQKGNTVNLLVNANGLTTDDTLKTTDSASLGSAAFLAPNNLATDTKYELSISKKDANTIIATVDNVTNTDPTPDPTPTPDPDPTPTPDPDPKPTPTPDYSNNERLKSLVETRAGVVTMINAGADMLAGQGMSNAAEAAADTRAGGGFEAFGAVSGGKLRAKSGSHVDTKGIGLNLGFARELSNKQGKLLFGPVIEYGHGSYDSYQDNGIKADGKTSYWGIGVIAKQTNHSGFYYEGSLRVGKTKSDYSSDLSPVNHASYDSKATYWAAHLGIGKVMDVGKDNTLDVYGKYFYSHTGSDNVTVHATSGDEEINFDAVNSHRLRIGTRLTHALNEKNRIYGGLAWQYEFKGDARATYNGGSTPSPSVKGSSGMMELGWQVKPGKSPMTIDLGVTGWVGKQRGITANLQANWTF